MKRIIVLLMALTVAGWSAAASAQTYNPSYRDYRDYRHPASVRSIVNQLQDATANLYELAEDQASRGRSFRFGWGRFGWGGRDGRFTYQEVRALDSLRDLEFAARRLQNAVATHRNPIRTTRSEYRMLIDAHQRASANIGRLRPSSAVWTEFRRVDRLVADLIDLYA
jgi:hypothetical protein